MHHRQSSLSVFGFLLIIHAVPAMGHHSIAPFDLDRTISLDATVVRLEWANPHVYIQLEAMDQDGSTTQWMIEGGPPNLMSRSGWSSQSLTVGERVVASVHPMRNGNPGVALGESLTKADDTFLPIRETAVPSDLVEPAETSPVSTDSIFGRWIGIWDPAIAGRFLQPAGEWPASGWPANAAGLEAIQAYDALLSPSQNCNLEKPPFAMIWPGVRDIVADGDVVLMRSELLPERVIHLDAPSIPEVAQYAPDGYSIGHFEGTALVVETTFFEEHRRGLAQGLPSSRQKHLIERFDLGSDGTELIYEFRVEDPVYLSEPMTGTIRLAHSPNLDLVSIECDPQIARRYLDYE
jgi:hypothetical protein